MGAAAAAAAGTAAGAVAHVEYEKYQADAALVASCRDAITRWRASGEAIVAPGGVSWMPETARAFVVAIGRLFKQYNMVLWQQFDYCRRCGGGCCVPGASSVTAFDALALALLEQPFPEPGTAAARDCIYLGDLGCRWPQAWRPIKCWAFYCLGSGDWTLDAADARYAQITEALAAVVGEYLPQAIRARENEEGLALQQFLTDPIAFAEALGGILVALFVAPFAAHDGTLTLQPEIGSAAGIVTEEGADGAAQAALAFIARETERIWLALEGGEGATGESALDDLERLEWIILERPSGARQQLAQLLQRYGAAADNGDAERRFAAQMAAVIQALL